MKQKYCYKCKETEEPLWLAGKGSYMCRKCNTEAKRKYRQGKNGKLATQRAVTKYENSNPKRRKAWNIAGRNFKKQPCEICGAPDTHRHHPDISKPLEIKFLCPLHHKQAHKLELVVKLG